MNSGEPLVVVIGAMNLDILATASADTAQGDSTPGGVGFAAGGVGRNIAEALTRLGADTRLFSLLGNDAAGDQLLSLCKQAQMTTAYIQRLSDGSTPVYVAINNPDGEMQRAVSDMSLIDTCTVGAFADFSVLLPKADLTVIDANLPEALIEHIALLPRTGWLAAEAVSVSKCVRLRNILPQLDVLKVNRQEAAMLAGLSANESPQVLARALLELGPHSVLMTMAAAGSLLVQRDGEAASEASCGAPEAEVVNVNGAGDSQFAAVLAARLYGHDATEQLRWGNLAAAASLATHAACSDTLNINTFKRKT